MSQDSTKAKKRSAPEPEEEEEEFKYEELEEFKEMMKKIITKGRRDRSKLKAARAELRANSTLMKKVFDYITTNNLQDPENKQWFTPDETMAPIFGKEKIQAIFGEEMTKYLEEPQEPQEKKKKQ